MPKINREINMERWGNLRRLLERWKSEWVWATDSFGWRCIYRALG